MKRRIQKTTLFISLMLGMLNISCGEPQQSELQSGNASRSQFAHRNFIDSIGFSQPSYKEGVHMSFRTSMLPGDHNQCQARDYGEKVGGYWVVGVSGQWFGTTQNGKISKACGVRAKLTVTDSKCTNCIGKSAEVVIIDRIYQKPSGNVVDVANGLGKQLGFDIQGSGRSQYCKNCSGHEKVKLQIYDENSNINYIPYDGGFQQG